MSPGPQNRILGDILRIGTAAASEVPHVVDNGHLIATGKFRKARATAPASPAGKRGVVALGFGSHPATLGAYRFMPLASEDTSLG